MNSSKSRTLALVMLCLIAHALLVSITHHHDGNLRTQQSSLSVGSRDSNRTSETSNESDCLSCRLQRNFNSSLQPTLPIVEILREPLNRLGTLAEIYSRGTSLILSSRAPPLS